MTEPGPAGAARRSPGDSLARAALVAVVVLGAALRGARLFHAGYHGDEPFEIFARRAVLDHGWPLLPSGQAWPYGGILLWFGAPFTAVGGMSVFWNRLPMFLLGTLAVFVTGRIAAKRLGPWAGVLAAAALAFHPGHVEWSASVKIYAAASLLVALAAERWLAWVVDGDDAAALPFALTACLPALVHPAAAFAVAGFGIGALAVRGPRFALRPRTMLAFAPPILCVVLFLWTITALDPGMSEHLVGESRAEGARRAVAAVKHLAASFRSNGWGNPWNAPLFVMAAAGVVAALARRVRGPWGTAERLTVAAAAAWAGSVAAMALVSRHQGAAYLVPASPFLALAAAGGAVVLVRLAGSRTAVAAALGAVWLAATTALTWRDWPPVFDGHDDTAAVYARLAAESRPGDLSLGGGPHAWLYSDGRVTDHMVFGGGLGASSFLRDGRPYDRMFGRPVLRTVAEVAPAVAAARRTFYLVTPKDLSSGRVLPEVHAWILARTTLLASARDLSLYATAAE